MLSTLFALSKEAATNLCTVWKWLTLCDLRCKCIKLARVWTSNCKSPENVRLAKLNIHAALPPQTLSDDHARACWINTVDARVKFGKMNLERRFGNGESEKENMRRWGDDFWNNSGESPVETELIENLISASENFSVRSDFSLKDWARLSFWLRVSELENEIRPAFNHQEHSFYSTESKSTHAAL